MSLKLELIDGLSSMTYGACKLYHLLDRLVDENHIDFDDAFVTQVDLKKLIYKFGKWQDDLSENLILDLAKDQLKDV